MGLFNNGVTRPGKGITKEEAAQRNYFEILGRHFLDLIKLNLLFVLCILIFIGASVLLSIPYIANIEDAIFNVIWQSNFILPLTPFIPFMFIGPFVAGLTYVLRNWSRQEHAFLVSDFFEHTQKNLKQGLMMSIISTSVIYLFCNALLFYVKSGLPVTMVLTVAGLLAVFLLTTSFYTYPMIVTFDMKLKDIIKNSFIFAMAKLPQNCFYLLILCFVHVGLLWYLPIIWALLMAVFLIAWTGFTINYYTWHIMNKYMITRQPFIQENNETTLKDTH
ncbi:MAG: hypothetical protein E7393_03005 [Ruminococcaceae bacterium]|nr:hypothetical protein [Oscillospiraceae bacterium]